MMLNLFVSLLSWLSLSVAHASEPSLPRLFFSYSWLYDSVVCEQTPIDAKWMDEIEAKTEGFANAWATKGPVFFNVLFEQTGLGFSRKEMSATFSVCPKKPSYSDPLVLNMTRYLESHMGTIPTKGEDDFVDLVFHELLHTWVVEHLESSQLRRKYKDELPSVKNHMHLMAIQKFVYSKLGRIDLITLLDVLYGRIIGGTYARAWEIVNIEGHEAFVNEFPKAVK